jgi:hypothetical protein
VASSGLSLPTRWLARSLFRRFAASLIRCVAALRGYELTSAGRPGGTLYGPALSGAIHAAFARLHATLAEAGPTLWTRVCTWMDAMGGVEAQIAGYEHPLSYPMLLLPWWAEKALHDPPNSDRQADLVYSTINGYYAIRLIDNVMDAHATVELDLLPALHVFSAEFQRVYRRQFDPDHPFWLLFDRAWYHTAEVTLRDAGAVEIDHEHFMQVTSRKTEAVKIPIAAVCYSQGHAELVPAWEGFVDLFGCWHQMSNDLFDWRKDLELGTHTYILSEATRRAAPDEPVVAWLAREGFAWAIVTLDGWMAQLKVQASALGSPDLLAYLDLRDQMLADTASEFSPVLDALGRLFDAVAEA